MRWGTKVGFDALCVSKWVAAGLAVTALPAAAQVAPAAAAAPAVDEYRIGPGDELSVIFPYNAELNHDGPVGPDGRFTLPLLGNLSLAGATVDEATARIAVALRSAGLVENARPSVTIRQYGASVYVGGEVRSPGLVKLQGGMDAMQAVIVAGGALDTARNRKVVIIRRGADGAPVLRYVDLRSYVRHGMVAGAEPLRAQDVIFVPKSSVAEANLWIEQHIDKMLPFSRSVNYSIGNQGTVISR